MGLEILIPVLGIMTGIIVPVSVFVWLYFESKDKNKTILEISKNIDDPSKVEDLIGMLDERKIAPITSHTKPLRNISINQPKITQLISIFSPKK